MRNPPGYYFDFAVAGVIALIVAQADGAVRTAVEQLDTLIKAHDVVFLLTDTRERYRVEPSMFTFVLQYNDSALLLSVDGFRRCLH